MSENEDHVRGGEKPPQERDENAVLPAVPVGPAELGAVMRPLKDLADAFHANTETLRAIAEAQARMGRRLERSDRSEAVIDSTRALNDTFRGVKQAQEHLIGRLEQERRRPWVALVTGFVVAAAFVGGGLWLVLDWLADRDETTTRAGAEIFTGALADKDANLAEMAERNREISVELATARTQARELDARVAELADRVEALVTENANLRSNQVDMDELRKERSRLAGAVARLEDELASARRELKKAREDLSVAAERAEAAEKSAAAAGKTAAAAPAAAPENPEPAPIPAGAVTDARELDRVMTVLNRLLAETAGGAYRFEKIGGLRGKVLYDVEIVDGRAGGRGTKTFEASEARIAIDAARKRVEIRLAGGTITYYGVRARFWDDRYVLPLSDVATEAWLRSGLTILEST